MPRRHLFLATVSEGYGEALVGLHLAKALHAEGDHVSFLFPTALAVLFRDLPFRVAKVDLALMDLKRALRETVREQRFDNVVLVDLTTTFYSSRMQDLATLLDGTEARTVGFDLWNLPETNLTWDVADYRVSLPRSLLDVPALRPCPVARPSAAGAFRYLPTVSTLSSEEKRAVRAEMGLGPSERLVITTSASWQVPMQYHHDTPRRLALGVPGMVRLLFSRLPEVRLVHVGPQPFPWGEGESRYHHHTQLEPARFRRMLAASDLLLSFNAVATSIAAAIAARVPVGLGVNHHRGDSLEEVEAGLGRTLPDDVRAWLTAVLPLRPFKVCPIGLHEFVSPILAGNPYLAACAELDVLDPEASVARLRGLFADEPARDELLHAQSVYRDQVTALPSAVERYRELTA